MLSIKPLYACTHEKHRIMFVSPIYFFPSRFVFAWGISNLFLFISMMLVAFHISLAFSIHSVSCTISSITSPYSHGIHTHTAHSLLGVFASLPYADFCFSYLCSPMHVFHYFLPFLFISAMHTRIMNSPIDSEKTTRERESEREI